MRISCEQCGKRYDVNPLDIKGRQAKFKCRKCGHLVTVLKPDSLPEELTPDVPSPEWDAGDVSARWPEPEGPVDWQEPVGPEDWPEPEEAYDPHEDDYDDGMYETQDADSLQPGDAASSAPADKKKVDRSAARPQIKGMSLKLKITLIIVLLVFVSLVAVGWIASYQSHEALSNQAETHLKRTANQKATEYGQIFDRVKEELEGMAAFSAKTLERKDITTDIGFGSLIYGDEGPAEGEELAEMEKQLHNEILQVQRIGVALQSVVAKNRYLSLGYISTDNALTLFDNLGVLEKIRTIKKFHPHQRPWYIKAKEEKKTIWTDLYVDVASDELTVTCATPVFLSDGTYKGVIGFDVLLETIRDDILTLDIGYNSYAFLVNQQGDVLVKPGIEKGELQWDKAYDAENWLKTDNEQFNAVVRDMVRMKDGIATYSAKDGERYVAYAPLESLNVSMGIVAFKNEVVKPATDMRNLIILVLAGVLILAVIIGIFLGNTITRPINRLTVMADLMSQGQMDLEVLPEDRKDELGVLTKSFNRLIISLKMALSRR